MCDEVGESTCSYYPSYEMAIDELRDYRWYAADMVHPSGPAVAARNCTVRERRVGLPRAAQVGHERHGELRPRPLLVPAREERKLGGT